MIDFVNKERYASALMRAGYSNWIIVAVGVLVKMAGLGFGRFAYSLLLPYMRESLGFTYTQMGLLGGGILLGYFIFSFLGGVLATRFGPKRVVAASLLYSSISMVSMSQLSGFLPMLFFAFSMGAGAAGAHISMTTLPMVWFEKRTLGSAIGIIAGGTGLGIVVTGLFLPPLLISHGKEAWRDCWILMAGITFAVAVASFILLREKPEKPLSQASREVEGAAPDVSRKTEDSLDLRLIFLVYFIFGFAYIIYATYYVAFLVEEIHLSEKSAGNLWAVFGWTCMISGLVWGFLSDRMGRRRALLWNNGLISLALFLPLVLRQPFSLAMSPFLFGFTFLGTVAVIAAAIGDQVGERRASIYGLVTLIHGIGQFLGTTMGGYLKDLSGSFSLTFLFSLTGFLICLTLMAFQKKRG